jgi:uncharacterized protein
MRTINLLQLDSTTLSNPPPRRFASSPVHPDLHLFQTTLGPHLFVVDRSQVFGLGQEEYLQIRTAQRGPTPRQALTSLMQQFGLLSHQPAIDDSSPVTPPLRTLSLAVAQACNLGCTYCYAQQGSFGQPPQAMASEVALAAVGRLLRSAPTGSRVTLAFLGGEPLLNRRVLRAATVYAATLARDRQVHINFSITTNGTLISLEDAEFFENHAFAVTISLDGVGVVHDRLRPHKDGTGTYDTILTRVEPLLRCQQRMQVSARVTVTPKNICLRETLEELAQLGFYSVGFSPMLSSPTGSVQMSPKDLRMMLDQMCACGLEFESRVIAGQHYPFQNLATALSEIHRGTHRPYPCGAGAGYLGVSADGKLSACHRFVGDDSATMGDLVHGTDVSRQARWLHERHVHRQEPCRSCWARYLCGGGCHHEAIRRGRPACDYIRGWLHYCLQAYVRLLHARPDYFHFGSGHERQAQS